MATVATEDISRSGLNPTYNAANAGGDKFTPGRKTVLIVKNADASSHDVSISTPGTYQDLAIADVTVTVPAGGERVIGTFPPDLFQQSDGLAWITWTAVTGMTFAVVSA